MYKFVLVMTLTAVGIYNNASAQYRHSVSHTVVGSSNGASYQTISVETVEAYDIATVDVQPSFPGGINAMYSYINKVRRYPAHAYNNRIQGRVLCSFVVNSDGSISHINIIRGIEPSLDNEAVRIIEEMPKWVAGCINNKPVPIYCILPIVFRL